MATKRASEGAIDLKRFVKILRKQWKIVAACGIIAAACAAAYALSETKQYTATASVLFNSTQDAAAIAGVQPVSVVDPQSVQDTNVELLKISPAAGATATQMGPRWTARDVRDHVSIAAVGDTSVVTVAATAASPVTAARLANIYVSKFTTYQRLSSAAYYQFALSDAQAQLRKLSTADQLTTEGVDLQQRIESLQLLQATQASDTQVAQRAVVPREASSPHVKVDVGGALIFGIIFGLIVIGIIDQFDSKVGDPEELEPIYDRPLLGTIGQLKEYRTADFRRAGADESFHVIRARLRYFNVDKSVKAVAVTSAQPGEGKSTVATRLALAAASVSPGKVVLVEADLRRSILGPLLRLAPGPGLAELLVGTATESEVTRSFNSTASDQPRLFVIPAGIEPPPNPEALLESEAFREFIKELADKYELVIIDTAPLMPVSDTIPMLSFVDGVMVVARVGVTRKDEAARLRATLESLGAPLLGVIANGVPRRLTEGYGYGAYSSARGSAETVPRDSPDRDEAPLNSVV